MCAAAHVGSRRGPRGGGGAEADREAVAGGLDPGADHGSRGQRISSTPIPWTMASTWPLLEVFQVQLAVGVDDDGVPVELDRVYGTGRAG